MVCLLGSRVCSRPSIFLDFFMRIQRSISLKSLRDVIAGVREDAFLLTPGRRMEKMKRMQMIFDTSSLPNCAAIQQQLLVRHQCGLSALPSGVPLLLVLALKADWITVAR
jgi:hypothetical protein